MKSIGGFLALELATGNSRYQEAIALDLGRHALEVVLRARDYHSLLAPRYTCAVLAPAIKRAGVKLTLYDLDENLDPVMPVGHPRPGEALLYTNYYGLKQATVEHLVDTVPNLLLDYAQDFYGAIPKGVDAFVSCRKFLGVPDGAYLYCEPARALKFELADAAGRFNHLLVAADQGIEAGYPLSQEHERRLSDAPVKGMSRLTGRFMASIDHAHVITRRQRNRDHLHQLLGPLNKLPIDPAVAVAPMVYPFMTDNAQKLRARLQKERIYTARYWPELLGPLGPGDGGNRFLEAVVYLPVDQRFGPKEMDKIVEVVIG